MRSRLSRSTRSSAGQRCSSAETRRRIRCPTSSPREHVASTPRRTGQEGAVRAVRGTAVTSAANPLVRVGRWASCPTSSPSCPSASGRRSRTRRELLDHALSGRRFVQSPDSASRINGRAAAALGAGGRARGGRMHGRISSRQRRSCATASGWPPPGRSSIGALAGLLLSPAHHQPRAPDRRRGRGDRGRRVRRASSSRGSRTSSVGLAQAVDTMRRRLRASFGQLAERTGPAALADRAAARGSDRNPRGFHGRGGQRARLGAARSGGSRR